MTRAAILAGVALVAGLADPGGSARAELGVTVRKPGLGAKDAGGETLTARYRITYNGLIALPVGEATLRASLDGPSYRIGFQLAPDGAAASLVGLKAASGAAAGARAGARLVPGALDLSYAVSALSETRQARFGGGALVNAGVVKIKRRRRIAYDPRALPAFVPLPEPETKALLDPLTAMFLPVSGGDPGNPANCNRRLRLYDGQRRFDLVMSYVRTESGPEGARPVCAARYVPVAGHGADGDAYAASLAASRIEATLAPVAGGRFLLPVRVRFSGSGGSGEAVATSVTGG